ncbi:hypothetical protein U1Q18_012703 [Sarracenia purpurea var. burkii]
MEELSLTIQSRVDLMAAQMLGVMTKSRGLKVSEVGVTCRVERRGGIELGDPVAGELDGSTDVGCDDEVVGIEAGRNKGERQGGERIELRLKVSEACDGNARWNIKRERRETGGDNSLKDKIPRLQLKFLTNTP